MKKKKLRKNFARKKEKYHKNVLYCKKKTQS